MLQLNSMSFGNNTLTFTENEIFDGESKISFYECMKWIEKYTPSIIGSTTESISTDGDIRYRVYSTDSETPLQRITISASENDNCFLEAELINNNGVAVCGKFIINERHFTEEDVNKIVVDINECAKTIISKHAQKEADACNEQLNSLKNS